MAEYSYIDRLKVATSDLENSEYIESAYNTLFDLLSDFVDDAGFLDQLIRLCEIHPNIVKEINKRINTLQFTEKEKFILLKDRMNSIFPSESITEVENANRDSHTESSGLRTLIDFYVSASTANAVAVLISLAVLIGGLSAGYESSPGIIFALILLSIATLIFFYNLRK